MVVEIKRKFWSNASRFEKFDDLFERVLWTAERPACLEKKTEDKIDRKNDRIEIEWIEFD